MTAVRDTFGGAVGEGSFDLVGYGFVYLFIKEGFICLNTVSCTARETQFHSS